MIGAYDFCGHYEWTFAWLDEQGGHDLVRDYWTDAISKDSQQHASALIREHGFDVGGLCGGACACATCHVEVHAEWADKLYPANDDEEAMLDEVPVLSPTSRLSCQIIYTEELNGLAVKLVANG